MFAQVTLSLMMHVSSRVVFFCILCHLTSVQCNIHNTPGLYGDSVGCFQDRDSSNKTLIEVYSTRAAGAVDTCLKACSEQYFRFAHLRDGQNCLCSSVFEYTQPGECTSKCRNNSTQLCGGPNARSIYYTGQIVPGPPSIIQVLNSTDTSALIKWSPPLASNGKLVSYVVVAAPVQSFAASLPAPRQWVYPTEITRVQLMPLHPATTFNLSVYAVSEEGNGIPKSMQFTTQVGDPEVPEVPTIARHDKDKIVINMKPAESSNGPITSYQVIVVDERVPIPFQASLLKSWSEAQMEEIPYYITAELNAQVLPAQFVVGDGETYGGYYNAPLPEDAHIHIGLGVISAKDGVRKVAYAHATHEQHGIVILHVADSGGANESSALVIGLSIAIAIFGVLLFLSIVVFIGLRHRVHSHRRRLPEHQELSLQGPMLEVESSGVVHAGFLPEENEERPNHYEQLRAQVWNIPRNFLEVTHHVLGAGRFGEVRRGTVQMHGLPVPAAVHLIADTQLAGTDKRAMLRDLDTLIRAGKHEHVVSLLGTCENPEVLYAVVEHHPASLKDSLLESRQLVHSPSLSRICSLSEEHLLRVALGVAQGMDYLFSRKIVHKQLAARNILLADGLTAKISGHGIADMQRAHEKSADYTRWTAQEIFRSRHYVSKSDVWSFGVLLWEIAALGGTPYCQVLTRELPARVMRGLLLPQLAYVSDDMYQLMLQCWQVDLDERPTFEQISGAIQDLLHCPSMHLQFTVHAGFEYSQYLADAERQA